jgi:hypothetical protein
MEHGLHHDHGLKREGKHAHEVTCKCDWSTTEEADSPDEARDLALAAHRDHVADALLQR